MQTTEQVESELTLSVFELRERIKYAEHGLGALAFAFEVADDFDETFRYAATFNALAKGIEQLTTMHDSYVLSFLLITGDDYVNDKTGFIGPARKGKLKNR
jgi:hypothetical protein